MRHERTSADRLGADIQFQVTVRPVSTLLGHSQGLLTGGLIGLERPGLAGSRWSAFDRAMLYTGHHSILSPTSERYVLPTFE